MLTPRRSSARAPDHFRVAASSSKSLKFMSPAIKPGHRLVELQNHFAFREADNSAAVPPNPVLLAFVVKAGEHPQ